MRHPRPHRLHQQPHRLARHLGEALHPQHVRRLGRRRHPRRQLLRPRHGAAAPPRSCRSRRGRAPARRRAASAGRRSAPRPPAPARAAPPDRPGRARPARSSPPARGAAPPAPAPPPAPPASSRSAFDSTIRSAQATWSPNTSSTGSSWSSEASAARCAASASRSAATRPSASAGPSTTATMLSTVTRLFTPGHWKACTSGFGSASPLVSIRMWSTRGTRREDPVQRRHEVVGHRAADAAVRELDDILLRAALDPAALQDLAVDPDVAELVDEDRQPPPAGVLQQMPDQRRLPGPEKPGDDGARNPCGGARSWQILQDVGMGNARDRARASAPRAGRGTA